MDGTTSKQMFRDFREDHGIIKTTDTVIPYKLREEQQRAVAMTVDYQAAHKDGEFLGMPSRDLERHYRSMICAENRCRKSTDCDKPTSDCKFVVFRLCQISG